MAAFLFAFQLNRTGTTGKSGDDGNHTEPGATVPASPGQDPAKAGGDTPSDG
ncbi:MULTISPECIES: hypothetical protein [Streptomyces]|uniref:hypothetical protein n=1 Tax=Streptomyces TaxID=1883 RepID=UPI001E561C7F|nr:MULTISPECIES: hypothetical protein [Streptomyces]